jgi:hypothetical protein
MEGEIVEKDVEIEQQKERLKELWGNVPWQKNKNF